MSLRGSVVDCVSFGSGGSIDVSFVLLESLEGDVGLWMEMDRVAQHLWGNWVVGHVAFTV